MTFLTRRRNKRKLNLLNKFAGRRNTLKSKGNKFILNSNNKKLFKFIIKNYNLIKINTNDILRNMYNLNNFVEQIKMEYGNNKRTSLKSLKMYGGASPEDMTMYLILLIISGMFLNQILHYQNLLMYNLNLVYLRIFLDRIILNIL